MPKPAKDKKRPTKEPNPVQPEKAVDLPAVESFEELNLSEPLMRAVKEAGYESPTPIQARAIPVLLAGKDLIGQAQTGTGKTAAFALPLLERTDRARTETQV